MARISGDDFWPGSDPGTVLPDAKLWTARPLRLSDSSAAALFYLLIVSPILIPLTLVFVPLHGPDDYAHVQRAYTLANGEFWPATQANVSSGGYIDIALV